MSNTATELLVENIPEGTTAIAVIVFGEEVGYQAIYLADLQGVVGKAIKSLAKQMATEDARTLN